MKNITKRLFSIVLCVMMTLSMLTAIVLPAAAAETETSVDAYAKVTVKEGTQEPTDNIIFLDPVWESYRTDKVATGTVIEDYVYAGNGETYDLKWGVNAFSRMTDIKTPMQNYATSWAADTTDTVSQDFVVVVAAGKQTTALGRSELASRAAEGEVPTPEQLLNVYFLGVKAGINPVNDARANAADVKIIANGRDVTEDTESLLTQKVALPGYSNITIDGFAGNGLVTFYPDFNDTVNADYINVKLHNIVVSDMTTSWLYQGKDKNTTWEFKNCYFNYNAAVTDKNYADQYQKIQSPKVTMDNCALLNGSPTSDGLDAYTQWFVLPTKADATKAANFYGEYAAKPEIIVKNCVSADWKSNVMFHVSVGNASATGYNAASIKIDFLNNKFYDFIGSSTLASKLINLAQYKTMTLASVVNITGNVFTAPDSAKNYDRSLCFIDASHQGTPTNVTNTQRGFEGKGTGLNMTISENIFCCPNEYFGTNRHVYPINTASGDKVAAVDLSANLFMDEEGNVLPNWQYNPRTTGYAVQSDIYASKAMCGGIREVLSVKDVKGGALLYNYIMLTVSTAYSGGATSSTHNPHDVQYNKDYFMGAVTVLLERGKTYNTEDMFVFGDENTEFVGVYEEEACETEVTTLTQDMFNNGGKFYLKAIYTEGDTTATVVYGLNSPSYYYIVAPADSDYYKNGEYTFNGITYTANQSDPNSEEFPEFIKNEIDGVTAVMDTNISNKIRNAQLNHNFAQRELANGGYFYGYEEVDFGPTTFGLDSLILLTPGKHANKQTSFPGSAAIVGPKFAVSPYDSALNANGELTEGRSLNEAEEAILPISARTVNNLNANHFSFHGLVIQTGTNAGIGYEAIRVNTGGRSEIEGYLPAKDEDGNPLVDENGNPVYEQLTDENGEFVFDEDGNPVYKEVYKDFSWKRDSDYTAINVKNCVFNTYTTIAGGVDDGNRDMTINAASRIDFHMQDSVYYSVGTDVKTPDVFFSIEATRKVVNNFAVMTEYCHSATLHEAPYRYTGKACTWKTTHEVLDTNTDVIYKFMQHAQVGESIVTEPTWTTAGEKSYDCACGGRQTESIVVATIGDTTYDILAEAFDAATANDTIVVQYNVTGTTELMFVRDDITVDLNGHQLTADYVVALKGASVIDSSDENTGKLFVPQNRIVLDTENSGYMPIYSDGGFVFATLKMREIYKKADLYCFSPVFETFVHDALAAGAESSSTKVIVRVSWLDESYVATQNFIYKNENVAEVVNSYGNPYANEYELAFEATLLRADADVKDYTVSAAIVSDTGVVIASTGLLFPGV